jgi:hypothetical protein
MKYSHDVRPLTFLSDRPYGIVLDADYTAEHEHGLGGLHEALGCDGTVEGIGRYQASDDARTWIETRRAGRLRRHIAVTLTGCPRPSVAPALFYLDRNRSFTGWYSSDNFVVAGLDNDAVALIEFLGKRARERDLAVFTSNRDYWKALPVDGYPFARAGLVIIVPSITPGAVLRAIASAHSSD